MKIYFFLIIQVSLVNAGNEGKPTSSQSVIEKIALSSLQILSSVATRSDDEHNEETCITKGAYTYAVCNKNFNSESTLKRHSLVHEDKDSCICKLYNTHTHSSTVKKPRRKHILEKPVEPSSKIGKIKPSPSISSAHSPREVFYMCRICQKYFPPKIIKEHRASHAELGFKCTKCYIPFRTINERRAHEQKNHGIMPFTCRCGKGFRYKQFFLRHRKVDQCSYKAHNEILTPVNRFTEKHPVSVIK